LNALQPNDFVSNMFCKPHVQSINTGKLNPQLLAVEHMWFWCREQLLMKL